MMSRRGDGREMEMGETSLMAKQKDFAGWKASESRTAKTESTFSRWKNWL